MGNAFVTKKTVTLTREKVMTFAMAFKDMKEYFKKNHVKLSKEFSYKIILVHKVLNDIVETYKEMIDYDLNAVR